MNGASAARGAPPAGPEPAPFRADLADGPEGGAAYWIRATDGLRLRVAHWPGGAKGTVLLFPGRTEYVEKYGRAAREFAARGYGTAAIDWRGQGLADRLLDDRLSGHVALFRDYQLDVAALLDWARALRLPEPFMLAAHSMGGCIGLRALIEGLPVAAAAFSAPMWGIRIAPGLRPMAWTLSWGLRAVGLGHRYTPGTSASSYVSASDFDVNLLTHDEEMFAYMARQIEQCPDLALGGPSTHWLSEALHETRLLNRIASPPVPALTLIGAEEAIVDADRVRERMLRWPLGRIETVPGARHEVMMETPPRRRRFFDGAAALFDAHRPDRAARSA